MKKKIDSRLLGFLLLLLVIGTAGIYSVFFSGRQSQVTLNGYLGGEKIGLFEDEEVRKILKKKYGLEMEYAKAGSLDMMTADFEGKDYLFPSSQTALSYYRELHGNPLRSEIILNTPIVLYTHKIVKDALVKEGIVEEKQGVCYVDMKKMTDLISSGEKWSDVGLPQLYGTVSIDTTDPAKSNSGNMFAALLANVLAGGTVVNDENVGEILPKLKTIFNYLGYMETSSADLFTQFLKMGVGAKPMIAGYESQLLEFAVGNQADFEQIKDDVVMLYPSPTVWSTHVYIALDNQGERGVEALLDEDVQRLAWERHGFRTSYYTAGSQEDFFGVKGIAPEITGVMQVPDYGAMEQIINYLK